MSIILLILAFVHFCKIINGHDPGFDKYIFCRALAGSYSSNTCTCAKIQTYIIYENCISIPSSASITMNQLSIVVKTIKNFYKTL